MLYFYGGLNNIGGNKICVVNAQGKGLLLDFGRDYSTFKMYFDEFMKPRSSEALLDSLLLGLIPWPIGPLKGIYRPDYFKKSKSEVRDSYLRTELAKKFPNALDYDSCEPAQVTGVLVSHAHSDHTGAIRYLHEDIPIVCSELTKDFIFNLDETSSSASVFKKIVAYKQKFQLKPKNERKVFKSNRVSGSKIPRKFILPITSRFSEEEENISKGWDIQYHETDHSMPGAGAFFLTDTTTGKKIIYTGDIRKHGPKSKKAFDFITRAKNFEPDVLICEGTRVGSKKEDKKGEREQRNLDNEEEVLEEVSNFLNAIPEIDKGKIVLFNCSGNDFWRIGTIFKAVTSVGRTMVIDPKTYYMLNQIDPEGILFGVKLDKVKVLLTKKGWGMYQRWDYSHSRNVKRLFTYTGEEKELLCKKWAKKINENKAREYEKKMEIYEKEIAAWCEGGEEHEKPKKPRSPRNLTREPHQLKKTQVINLSKSFKVIGADIRENQGDYAVYMPDHQLNQLLDINPDLGGYYIYSMSMPFDAEGELDEQRRLNWLNRFGIDPQDPRHFGHFHCSGHMPEEEIFEMIREIKPKIVVPVHTEHREKFQEALGEEIDVLLPKPYQRYSA